MASSPEAEARALREEERAWVAAHPSLAALRIRRLGYPDFEPWEVRAVPLDALVRTSPSSERLNPESPQLRSAREELSRGGALPGVLVLREPDGELFALAGRHLLRCLAEDSGEGAVVSVAVGRNRSRLPGPELYWVTKVHRLNRVLLDLERRLASFSDSLEPQWRAEFEGLESVLCRYLHFDLRNGRVDYTLMGYLVGNILVEMERLLRVGMPFTQELCGGVARGYDEIGTLCDDLYLNSLASDDRNLALLSYELANVWYRAAQHVESGLFPVEAQLRIVDNMVRLGTLGGQRATIRRGIRELCILLDTDRYRAEFLELVTGGGGGEETLTPEERQDLIHGFLDTRRKFRAAVRRSMAEAVRQYHLSIPPAVTSAYRHLESAIEAGEKGPSALLRFLEANLTVIAELGSVQGGHDFAVATPAGTRYMTILEHVEEIARALTALEEGARGLAEIEAGDAEAGAPRLEAALAYFRERVEARDRAKVDEARLTNLLRDALSDYREFTRGSPKAKVNFWLGNLLHDLGTLLLERHHAGGAEMVRSLLQTLEFGPRRQESVLAYVEHHGEYKRFYLLEKSPRDLLAFVTEARDRLGLRPDLLLVKRRVQSIVDLAATGPGRLSVGFLETTRTKKSIAAMEEVAARFGTLRRSVWGLEGAGGLYEEQVGAAERAGFFDRYFDEMRIVYYHNLRRELTPQALLCFHYLCARAARASGLAIETVRLTSDRAEHLRVVERHLGTRTVGDLRLVLDGAEEALRGLRGAERAARLASELRSRLGLILEFKDGDTLSVNSKLGYELEERCRGRG